MLLAAAPDPAFFQEWLDSFYARDITELFGIRNRIGFMSLLHLLLHRSGGLLDVTDLSKESGLSRPTVLAHLEAQETSHAIVRVSPWAGGTSGMPIVDTVEEKSQPDAFSPKNLEVFRSFYPPGITTWSHRMSRSRIP